MHLNLSFNKFEVVCLEVKSIPQLKLHRIPLWITSEVESVSKAKRWSVQFLSNALEWLFSKHTKYNIAMLYFVCFENNHSNALERNCTDQRFAFETLSTSEVIHRGIRCSFNWGMLFTSKQTTSNLLKDKFKCMNTN